MANTILHKRNSTPGTVPTSGALSQGELGINIGDGKLYTKNSNNNIINLGVTSISGTSITPSSGNFSDYLAVNGVQVSISGHTHNSVPQAQSIVTSVFNKTGNTIPKFSAVYINGGQGDQATIQLAIASNEGGSFRTYGITAEAISNMSSGNVVVAGALTGLNTDQFNPTAPVGDVNGSILFLSPSVSGALTTSKPSAPNHMVYMATIVRTHQTQGVVEVRVQNGYELEELHNVSISGVTNGQFLYYNSSSGLWLANQNIYSSGNNIGIGLTNPQYTFHVNGSGLISSSLTCPTIYTNTINSDGNNEILMSSTWNTTISAGEDIYLNPTNAVQIGGNGIFATNYLLAVADWNTGNGSITVGDGTTLSQTNWSIDNNGNASFNGNITKGDLVLGYNAAFDQYGLTNNNAGGAPLYIISDLAAINAYSSAGITIDGDNGNTILQPTYGSVGIGTASPSYKLDVNGGGNFTSLHVNNTPVSISGHTHDSSAITNFGSAVSGLITGTENYITKFRIAGSGITNSLIFDDGTNIGIGTVSPSGKLHVSGTQLIDGKLSIGQSSFPVNVSPSSLLHINGQVSNFGSLIITGQTNSNTILGFGNSNTTPYLSVVNGDLSSSTFGWGMFYRSTEGDFRLSRKSGTTSWIDCLNIQRSDGNIGIGSGTQATAPTERLVVDGNLRLSDTAGNRLQFYRGGGTADDYTIRYAGGAPYSLQISTSNDSTTQRCVHFGSHTAGTFSGKTSINGWTGNTSIGTITPNAAHRLTVVGSGTDSGGAAINATNSNNSSLFYVRNDGNVGIGTTSPSAQLHVIGSGFFSQGISASGFLTLNGTDVSVSGHTHNSSNITDFNSSVSGLLPVKDIVAGTNITVSSTSGVFTINSTGGGGSATLTDAQQAAINIFLYQNFS